MIKFTNILLLCVAITNCGDSARLQPLDTAATILAFGDSLTYGSGTSRQNAYPATLQTLINRKVINAGVPGEISKAGLQRLPNLINQHQPDLIIICHGGNDFLGKLDVNQTRQNIQQMIDIATENNIQVLIIAVPEFGLFLNTSPIYGELADRNDLPVAEDVLADILKQNAYKSDHVHPNAQGYKILAENINLLLIQTGAITGN